MSYKKYTDGLLSDMVKAWRTLNGRNIFEAARKDYPEIGDTDLIPHPGSAFTNATFFKNAMAPTATTLGLYALYCMGKPLSATAAFMTVAGVTAATNIVVGRSFARKTIEEARLNSLENKQAPEGPALFI